MWFYLSVVGNEKKDEVRKCVLIYVCDFVFFKSLSSRWLHKSKGWIPPPTAKKKECELYRI